MSTTTSPQDWICDPADREDPVSVSMSVSSDDELGTSISIGGQVDLGIEQARLVAVRILHLADTLTPATEDARKALGLPLESVNGQLGTAHTPESVARSLGIDLATATRVDITRIADHIGDVLMR